MTRLEQRLEQQVERAVRALVRGRWVVAALLMLLTVGSAAAARRVEIDGSIEAWFLDDDASLTRYHAFRDRFGADEFVLVVAFGEDALAPAGLQALERLRRGAEALPQVARTRWLTNASVADARGEDTIEVGPLARALPTTPEGARALIDKALDRAATRGLVSKDPPATSILVELTREAQDVSGKLALVGALRDLVERERAGLDVVLTGPPAFDEAFVRRTERDLGALGPIGIAALFLVIAVSLRRASLALVPVAVVTAALLWTFGGMGLGGYRVNLISSNLVCVLLAIGVADAIHLVSEYRVQGGAIGRAAAVVFVPCGFATLTTIAGMLSLATSDVAPIREFGVLAAAGVALAFVATFTLGPVLLSFMSPGAAPAATADGAASVWAAVARTGRRGRLAILWGSALVLAVACVGLSRLTVGVNPVQYFREDDPIRRATERVDATLGGTASVELQLETRPGGLEDPAKLAALAALRATLEQERGVSYSQSILDPLADLHRAWTTEQGALPGSTELAAQYYLLLESEDDVARLLRPDHSAARLSLRTQMSMTDRPMDVIRRIEERAQSPDLVAAGLDVKVTGYVHLMATMYDYLLASQIESALLAVPTIALAMLLLLRRLSLGLLALLPNILPLVVGLGLMGLCGIQLDVGTVMVGSITLGLVVDDTVHLLVRLREHLRGATVDDVPRALERTLAETGPPMVTISLAFVAGFGALAFGSFLANVYFGAISALVILLALACDLLLTPCLVLMLPHWFVDAEVDPAAPATTARVGGLPSAA